MLNPPRDRSCWHSTAKLRPLTQGGPVMAHERASADSFTAALAASLEGLGPVDLKVVHLVMHKAVELESQGRGIECDEMLMSLLRFMRD